MENSTPVELVKKEGSDETGLHNLDVELSDYGGGRNQSQIHSMNALEILRETVRILRFNSTAFMITAALLICPVSAVVLSNLLVDQSVVKKLTIKLLLVAKSSGLPLSNFIKQSCYRFAEMVVSYTVCFPMFTTMSLLSKAAVVYSVDCTYSKKQVQYNKFFVIVGKIWWRLLVTYLWVCLVLIACLTSFCVFLIACCSTLLVFGISSEMNLYAATLVGLVFSIVFAHAIIICNTSVVISVLEDVSGPQALFRSGVLIKGQTQVGLMIYLGSTIGMAMVEGLFEHRVKTLSYGDGSSRIWEGPLLVIMYSFVLLIDSMMSAVFCFSCRSSRMEDSNGECPSVLDNVVSGSTIID